MTSDNHPVVNSTDSEVVVLMIVMLTFVWLGKGHMGIMGHGTAHTEKSNSAAQQDKAESPQTTTHKKS